MCQTSPTVAETHNGIKRKENLARALQTSLINLVNKYRFKVNYTHQNQWQRLLNSSAKSHESPSVELSWAWEPSDREGARWFNLGTRSLRRVHCQDIRRMKQGLKKKWIFILTICSLFLESIKEGGWFYNGRSHWIWQLKLHQKTILTA